MAQGEAPGSGSSKSRGPRAPGLPSAGSSVTLVPAGDARLLTGTLLWWDEPRSDENAVVRAGVDIAPTAAQAGSLKVWATTHAAGGDTVVLSADAERGETPHILLLSGRVAAREPRRRSVRAPAHLDVHMTVAGAAGGTLSGRTLDLSAGGCRIAIDNSVNDSDSSDGSDGSDGSVGGPGLSSGEPTDLVIHLDRRNGLRLSGHVQAIRPGGQLVIRFHDVPDRVAEQIERYVYATLP